MAEKKTPPGVGADGKVKHNRPTRTRHVPDGAAGYLFQLLSELEIEGNVTEELERHVANGDASTTIPGTCTGDATDQVATPSCSLAFAQTGTCPEGCTFTPPTDVFPDHNETAFGEDDKTVQVFATSEQDVACPRSYYLLSVDMDDEAGTVAANCAECFEGCDMCTGPKKEDCTQCAADKILYVHIDGRSGCLEGCPECFFEQDGFCVVDVSNIECSHFAVFHPSVMPEDESDPAACQELDKVKAVAALETQQQTTSLLQQHQTLKQISRTLR